jgi:hypothetical protein
MSKRKSIICLEILFLWMGSLFLTSCSQAQPYPDVTDPVLSDRGWLDGKPCEIPCWHGLTPGVSKADEVRGVIKGLSFINVDRIYEKETSVTMDASGAVVPGIEIWAYDINPADKYGVDIHIVNDVFYDVYLFLNYQISLDEVVQKIGKPDGYDMGMTYPENKGCGLSVIWLSQNTIISLTEERKSFWEKDLCDKIHEADGRIPTGLQFNNIHFVSGDQMKRLSSPLTPWKGFEPGK